MIKLLQIFLLTILCTGVFAADWHVYTQWPFDDVNAKQRQLETANALGVPVERSIELGDGISLNLVLIPAGRFVMGAPDGESNLDPDEGPLTTVDIEKPFWLGKYEVYNQQYAAFDKNHDSRYMDTNFKDRVGPGMPLNNPTQPVIRVSCLRAEAFCQWLSQKTGENFRLPDEAEWEYACRAGTETAWSCAQSDLAKFANLADSTLGQLKPWALRDNNFNDGYAVTAPIGSYQPNSFGLFDMHGNVAEWTASSYLPYPYSKDATMHPATNQERAVRGGSWDDRPRRVRSACRMNYLPDYSVYNVGIRVACDITTTAK